MHAPRFALACFVVLSASCIAHDALASSMPAPAKVGADVYDRLAAAPRANVVVVFAEPAQTLDAAHATQRRTRIAATADAVLANLPPGGYVTRRRFDNV